MTGKPTTGLQWNMMKRQQIGNTERDESIVEVYMNCKQWRSSAEK